MKDYLKTSPWRSYIQMRFHRSPKKEWKLFEHLEKVAKDQRQNLNQVAKDFLMEALQEDMKSRKRKKIHE